MKISHSRINRYHKCPQSYNLHYNRRIRPTWTSSALVFGDALDKAFNELHLKTGNDPYETFLKCWTNGEINKVATYFPTTTQLLYANKDYDAGLLTKEDHREIEDRITKGELESHNYDVLVKKKEKSSWHSFKDGEKKTFNFYNWLCMKNKAKFMIDGYVKEILPKIRKVHAVQIPINADNGAGDQITGYVDLIADVEWQGEIITALLDHKSSASAYKWDEASKSQQLALYKHVEGDNHKVTHVGYIVMKKNLANDDIKTCSKCGHDGSASAARSCDKGEGKDRCKGAWDITYKPRAEFQFLISYIEPSFEEMVMESIDETTQAIKAGVYPKNMESCYDWFGGHCPYVNLCQKKSMKNLEENKE